MSFELIVQVSDGMETSAAVYLPVSVMPLQLRMINNTGLILVHKSSALITPWNLSFISNSEDDNVDIRYSAIIFTFYCLTKLVLNTFCTDTALFNRLNLVTFKNYEP